MKDDFDERCYESLVDPITGEILESKSEPFDTSQLERFGRAIRAIRKRQDMAKLSYNSQLAILKEIYDGDIEKLKSQEEYLVAQSRLVCETNNLDGYKSGAGKFRWQKQQPVVDLNGYDDLTPEKKDELYKKFPNLFTVKIAPSLTSIKNEAKVDGDIGEFRLVERESKFIFSEE